MPVNVQSGKEQEEKRQEVPGKMYLAAHNSLSETRTFLTVVFSRDLVQQLA